MSVAARLVNRSSIAATASPHIAEADRRGTRPYCAGLSIELISDLETFQDLEQDWNTLICANRTNQLAFQSFTWMRSWLTTYLRCSKDQAHTVSIVTARVNGQLRLICPFAIQTVLGVTSLTWLGEPASQYGDILSCRDDVSPDLINATLGFAIDKLQPDVIHLRKVRDDAAILPWLTAQKAVRTAIDEAPYLNFRGAASFDAYCSKYTGKARKNRRRLRRRLKEAGPVSTTVLRPGAAARDAIHIGLAFKQAWLIERGFVSSALRDPHMPDFLAHFVSQPDDHAAAFVSIMHCAETPVSVQFGIIANHRLALHMIAYNPKTEKSGAGVLHIEDTISYCIENDLSEMDFLAPNAPYKQTWADAAIPVCDYVVPRTLKGRVYAQGYLCSTRDVLKNQIQALPLGIRQSIAKRIQKPL